MRVHHDGGTPIYVTELGEECSPGVPEDPPSEIIQQCAIALVISAPFGVALSVALGRRLANPTTERLDEVITSAKRMTGERLDERLPVSPNRDPRAGRHATTQRRDLLGGIVHGSVPVAK